MSFDTKIVALALAATLAAPASALAFGGAGPGCSNLPDYARAQGALEGMSTCDMSIAEARRITAAHDGTAMVDPAVAPAPRVHRRHRVMPAPVQP